MMGLFEQWPYVNFHDMNLDWIIKRIKNVETAEANSQASAEASAESAASSQLSAEASQASAEASQASAEASKHSAENAAESETNAAASEENAKNYADNIADPVSGLVTGWLDSHVTPTTPVVDDTLTITGAAADAKVTGDEITDLKSDVSDLTDSFSSICTKTLIQSRNLVNFNDPDFATGKYVYPSTGALYENTSYNTTGFIPVEPGQVIKYTAGEPFGITRSMNFIAAYDSSKVFVSDSGASSSTAYTVPAGAAYIRVSVTSVYFRPGSDAEPMIYEGTLPDKYEEYFDPYYDYEIKNNTLDLDSTLSEYGKPADAGAVGHAIAAVAEKKLPKYEQVTAASLSENTKIQATNFPRETKVGNQYSFSAEFDTFDELHIGGGNAAGTTVNYEFEIDATNIYYKVTPNTLITVPHGLTIEDYINVAISVEKSTPYISVSINTKDASYHGKLSNSENTRGLTDGTLFAYMTTNATNVKFTVSNSLLNSDVWMMGDSYFGLVYVDRVLNYIRTWEYLGDILCAGFSGENTTDGFAELQRLLNYGRPKYLVWYYGMNDSTEVINTYYPQLEALCDSKDITLIFNKIPLSPDYVARGTAQNNYVISSGRRYIDSYKAVGCDSSGNWIPGYLSNDNVHPTTLGAQALASQMLIDVPEIMESKID